MNQVYQVKKYKKELKKEQEGIVERRTFKQAKKETHMPRLSNIKWRAPDQGFLFDDFFLIYNFT